MLFVLKSQISPLPLNSTWSTLAQGRYHITLSINIWLVNYERLLNQYKTWSHKRTFTRKKIFNVVILLKKDVPLQFIILFCYLLSCNTTIHINKYEKRIESILLSRTIKKNPQKRTKTQNSPAHSTQNSKESKSKNKQVFFLHISNTPSVVD